ncbi:MAG: Gfo/Idh/MocA family oxidoreductase [Lachnospiraceae bacterium]
MKIRIGIVGSGMIVKDCLEAIAPLENVICTALCVREPSKEKGQALCRAFQIPMLYTAYQSMLSNRDLDFIYIGIVNTEHFRYAKQALEAHHHVILEKPFTITYAEAVELAQRARFKELYLFEAITTLHFPNFKYCKEQLLELGTIKLVQCNFSQYSSRYDRYLKGDVAPALDPALRGGALYDLNIYNIHFVMRLFGKPRAVQYHANRGFNGVDTSGILLMEYDGFLAECSAAKDSFGPNFGIIQGTKGYLQVQGQTSICKSVETYLDGKTIQVDKNIGTHHMQYEFLDFADIFAAKDLQGCYEYLEHSVDVMQVLEKAGQDTP